MIAGYMSRLTPEVYLVLILRSSFVFVCMFDAADIWYALGGFSQVLASALGFVNHTEIFVRTAFLTTITKFRKKIA